MWEAPGLTTMGSFSIQFQAGPTESVVIRELGTPLELTPEKVQRPCP